ncbi:MAG: hypothetical protein IJ064_03245 [Bacteroidaceae bacterium]|nr:hypothetical protein [Bacteroidaceae bacterium]
MRTLLKYCFLICLLLLCSANGWGQEATKVIKIVSSSTFSNEGDNKQLTKAPPVRDVYIYTFYLKSKAESAYLKLKGHQTDELDKQQDDYVGFGITEDDGMAEVAVPTNGWILIYAIDQDQVEAPKQVTAAELGESVIEYKLDLDRVMEEVKAQGTRQGSKKDVNASSSSCGGILMAQRNVFLDSTYTRSNARFVLSPIVISRNNPKDTIGYLPPQVVDGIDYTPSQVRYMAFNPKNDVYWENASVMGDEPSATYFKKGMYTRAEDTLVFKCKIRPYDENKPWKIIGHYWFEDYNTVYYENTVLLYPGFSQKPTKFLEWRGSVPKIEIDERHYEKRALTEPVPDSHNLKLLFKSGKADLDFSDSLTVDGLEKMYKLIESYYNNTDARITQFAIQGFASPEGRETTNRTLAHRRGETVRNLFAQRFPDRNRLPLSIESPGIFSWEEVADTIDALNKSEYEGVANELREICNQKNSLDAQNNIISKKSWFPSVKENVLPLMRRVRIVTGVIEQKKLTTPEIYERYKRDNAMYFSGNGIHPYQYYNLLNYLYKNGKWDELYAVSEAVYNYPKTNPNHDLNEITTRDSLTNERVKSTLNPEDTTRYKVKSIPVIRAYPLAAYYYAKCKLEKGVADTTILLNYLDRVANQGLYIEKEGRKHWNEEAIAITQIMMYCLLGDYREAHILSQYHLPADDSRFHRFRTFIKFLSCDYSADEKEDMRKEIEASSDVNFVVANLIDGEKGFKRALEKLTNEKGRFLRKKEQQALYYYLLAICRYNVECPDREYDTYYYNSLNIYDTDPKSLNNWAAPMLEALKLDPSWADFLKEDGFFNDAYRAMVFFFWERMKDGVPMGEIAKEYDQLAKKYFAPKK